MADKASFIFSAVFAAIGIGLLIAGSIFIIQGMSANSWETAEGTITTSYGHPSTENPGEIGRLDIDYQYEVKDIPYSGDRIGYHMQLPESKQNLLSIYPEEQVVTVFYNPGNPSASVLIPGISIHNFFLPAGGLVFVLAGFFLFRYEMKNRRKEVNLSEWINQERKKAAAAAPQAIGYRALDREIVYRKYITNKGGAVLVIILALFVIGFPAAVSNYFMDGDNFIPLLIGAGVFALFGLFMILAALNTMYSRKKINFTGETVEVRIKSLFRRKHLKEDMRNYIFITPSHSMVKSQFGSKNLHKYHYHICALMVHRSDPRKDITARLQTRPYYGETDSPETDKAKVEQFADELSLPVKHFS